MVERSANITYLDIQRLSTEDGPGLRTTIFFKGCPLKCAWCHNPESIRFEPEIICLEEQCIGCSLCETVCQAGARQRAATDRTLCRACAACSVRCPAAAIELKGTTASAADLARELLRDKAYWGSGGGVSLSGGEAASQAGGALALLRLLKEESVHTALDTCGQVSWDVLSEFLRYVDLFLYDIKLACTDAHKRLTGAGNELILSNAQRLHDTGAKMWLRTPVIPGATDSDENIREIGAFVRDNLPDIERWELCSYNNLGRDKYRRLDITYDFADAQLMTTEDMDRLRDIAAGYFAETIRTGPVRI